MGKETPIDINILGGRTNRNRPWDRLGPVLGTNWDMSLGQTGRFLFNSTVESPFCRVCPWDGPQFAVRKMFMCLVFIGFFFAPNLCLPFIGLAPRIFFIFAPLLREEGGGGGVRGEGEFL